MNKLLQYRKKIDKINSGIFKLLAERMKVVGKIGEYKKKKGMKVLDKKREKEILQKLEKKAGKYKLDKKFINDIFKLIMKGARRKQK